MSRSPGRLLARYVVLLVLALVVLTLVTQLLFAVLEGRSLAWHQALLFVVETMSTTGYGELLPFRSSLTTLYTVVLIALGFFALVVGLGSLANSWLSSRFAELPPTRAPRGLHGHVVVVGYGPLVDTLQAALARHGWPVLVVDRRPDVVAGLMRRGILVMQGDGSEAAALSAARLEHARALVAVGTDAVNAAVLLTARHLCPDVPRLATVEHAANAGFLEAAGAVHVVQAKVMLGEALGRWAAATAEGRGALVLGAGDVGQAAAGLLRSAGVPVRAVSLSVPVAGAGWLRGDATDATALTAAGISNAAACVIALDDDAQSIFATLVARRLAPDMSIAARANTLAAVDDLRLAGANYVISVAEVAGDTLAGLLLHPDTVGEEQG